MPNATQPVAKKAGFDDPALSQLPRANVRQGFDPSDFVTVPNIPVFAEHSTLSKGGRELEFGPYELGAVVKRCNQRIRETGDYATLTDGHTPDPEAKAAGAKNPPVMGYAGPFRLGVIGNPGERQRYAILADFHYFKDTYDHARKLGRRSPEVWLEDSYEEMFFDPIALLGAEAPRLDMGIMYAAEYHGRDVEKYTAVAPSATSVIVKEHVELPDEKKKDYAADDGSVGGEGQADYTLENPNQKEARPTMTPEDIRQIVDAMEQLDWVQWVKSQMGGEQPGPQASVPDAGMDPAGGAPPADIGGPPAMDAPAPDMPGPGGPPTGPPEPMMAGQPKQYGADDGNANATGEYQGTGGHEIKIGDPNPKANYSGDGMSKQEGPGHTIKEGEPNPKVNYSAQKYAAADAMDDEEFEDYSAQRRRGKRKYMGDEECGKYGARYMAAGSVEDSGAHTPTNGSAEPADAMKATSEGSGGNDSGEAAESYSRQRQNGGELERLKYALNETNAELLGEKSKRIDLERYQKLERLRFEGLIIDPDKEIEKCHYMRDGKLAMSDEQFEDRVGFMLEHAQRAPMNLDLYVPEPGVGPGAPGAGDTRERYSKETSDRARQIAERIATEGGNPDYAQILEDVRLGQTSQYNQAG